MQVIQRTEQSSHWYFPDGTPCFEVPRADGNGMTSTTLRHARKMGLLPSVTRILKVLHKEALVNWRIEQAVLAVLTTPRLPGEDDDAYVKRTLSVDREQDAERDAAAQFGKEIHHAVECVLCGNSYPGHLNVFVQPVVEELKQFGRLVATEKVIVGKGYAGTADAIFEDWVVDFKTTKKLPDESWPEHQMQLAAYAKPIGARRTANIYISTVQPGRTRTCLNEDSDGAYEAFMHVVKINEWLSGYVPL